MPFVNTHEYVGALSDFTGEIGRLAVASASKRDLTAVRNVLQADVAIYAGLMQINVGGKYTKKCDSVQQNLRKVEDVGYELSMLQRGARAVAKRDDVPTASKDEGGQED
jgi:predicted translin family RNA/ssDNA-binding protein